MESKKEEKKTLGTPPPEMEEENKTSELSEASKVAEAAWADKASGADRKISLAKKVFELKKEIGAITKDSTNPYFKSKYFDINALLSHLEPLFVKHGLMIAQPIIDGKVVTQLIDPITGEFIDSSLKLDETLDPQKLGSQITYFRRYTLQSLLALQGADDDGNRAVGNGVSESVTWLTEEQFRKASISDIVGIKAVLKKYSTDKFKMQRDYYDELMQALTHLDETR